MHTGRVTSVSISADQRLAVSGAKADLAPSMGKDVLICLWDVASGQCVNTFETHRYGLNAVCITADGHFVLLGGEDRAIQMWDVETGRCLRSFEGHKGAIKAIILSNDGRFVLTSGDDGTLRLWQVSNGRCLRTFGYGSAGTAISLSADGRWVLTADRDRGKFADTMRVWELPCQNVSVCTCRPSQPQTYAKLAKAEARLGDLLKQSTEAIEERRFAAALNLIQQARKTPGFQRAPQTMSAWAKLSRFCLRARLTAVWESRILRGHSGKVKSVCLGSDGRKAFSGSMDGTIMLWDVITGQHLDTFEGHKGGVTSISLSADGYWLLSGGHDNTLRLWEVENGRCVSKFKGHRESVVSVGLDANASLALSASYDKTVRLWDVSSGQCTRILKDEQGLQLACLGTDGQLALSAYSDYGKDLSLWNTASGRIVRAFRIPDEQSYHHDFRAVGLSADSRWAFSGESDTVFLWDTATDQCIRIFKGHLDRVNVVDLSIDGRWLLSGAGDNTLRLWEVETGRCQTVLRGHSDSVSSACLSGDGRWILSGSDDMTLRFWELDWELEARDPADWDERALPYLDTFLALHHPSHRGPFHRFKRHRPSWTEEDFQRLLHQLEDGGYGWLRPEGVRTELERMGRNWKGRSPGLGRVRRRK
jgi:WD40 repeat protein